jgi:putative heme-binding domain-containing protein
MTRYALVIGIMVFGGMARANSIETTERSSLDPLVRVLAQSNDSSIQRDVLTGMHEALKDRRGIAMPPGWDAIYRKLEQSSDPQVRHEATLLALLFGDPSAVRAMHKLVVDPSVETSQRQDALQALVQTNDPSLVPLLDKLLDDPQLGGAALQALAAFADAKTPAMILQHYPHFSAAQRRDAIMTLSSRSASAAALLDAVTNGQVPKHDLNAFNIRQIINLNDAKVDAQLHQIWPNVRPTSQDKLQLLAEYKAKFPPDVLKKADLSHGRLLFSQTCGVCHTLFDSGGQVGPNLTGAQRSNLDYLLGKVLDPSAVVSPDYRMTIVRTKDGRVINGIVQQETGSTLTLKAPNETIVVQKADIDKRKLSDSSLMPEGLLSAMSDTDARDLLAYLQSPNQVPMPKAK